ncbi:fasciclin domain-containing protein [Flavobacterium sp. W22_SRS_FP1]|uniref:fasciclin domain-containing protein n=1 Tax=Flavobacterium sp. W22_SRS_FP1 TaxID=3240276 RepID=UPI003F907AB1
MKTNFFKIITIVTTFMFSSSAFAQMDGTILNGVENTSEYKTIELINMDKDLSTFANLLTLSGLKLSLALTTEPHTLLVPTNETFSKMSIKRFAELTNPKNKTELIKFMNDHFLSNKYSSYEFKQADVIITGNNTEIEIYKDSYYLSFGGAKVIQADIKSKNGVIFIIDGFIEPSRY